MRLRLSAAAAAVAFALTGCGGGDGATTTTATGAPSPPPPPPASAPVPEPDPAPPAETPKPEPNTLTVVVRGGEVVGGLARATFDQGATVTLVVRADVADHVHLHGYDLTANTTPGRPARLTFTASLAGRFEVELEDRGLRIADLEVRP